MMIRLSKDKCRLITKQDKTKSYTYGLCRSNGELFYVGVGIRNRVFNHAADFELSNGNNRLKTNIIKKEQALGGISYILFTLHKDRLVCLDLEKKIISKFGRVDLGTGSLANLTDGGEIGPSGATATPETREKLSKVRREYREATSIKQKELWQLLSEEDKQKRISNMRSKVGTPEVSVKLTKKLLERWSDPEYRKRLSATAKVTQARRAEGTREMMLLKWADPVFREDMLERRRLARIKKLQEKSESIPE